MCGKGGIVIAMLSIMVIDHRKQLFGHIMNHDVVYTHQIVSSILTVYLCITIDTYPYVLSFCLMLACMAAIKITVLIWS